jgi:hypothetical protein
MKKEGFMQRTTVLEGFNALVERAVSATGLGRNALIAMLTLTVGLVLAVALGRLTRRLVRRGARVISGIYPKGATPPSTERLEAGIGDAVYWLIVVCSVMGATETLGLPVVTAWLSGVASFLPRVAAAVVIVALGVLAARVARHLIRRGATSAKLPSSERLARLGEAAVLTASVLVAVDELGIEVSFLKATLLIVLGVTLGGVALSFALGGRDLVANILSAYYVHKLYEVGQVVRIGETEGRILRITEISIVLECAEGTVAVPARVFADQRSTLVVARSSAK